MILAGGAFVSIAGAAWAVRHAYSTQATLEGKGTEFGVVFTIAFIILCWQTFLAYMERPVKVTPEQARDLDALRVTVAVPAYNEDPEALAACLRSLFEQTRKPQRVHVIDDGSTVDYGSLTPDWARSSDGGVVAPPSLWSPQAGEAESHGIELLWDRVPNGGKRHAQARVFAADPEADIYVTVDSDSLLADNALEELLKPLVDPRVFSVAGVVVALNSQRSFLTRVTDLWFVLGQLTDRSALSTMGSVLVNCGPLAAYRAGIIRENLDGYTGETFFGRRVEFSDDSMLTIYALAAGGRAVQQPSAFAFTLMPEKVGHHLRQYLRWMRGATIRSWWRFRYLPLRGYSYWAHAMGWFQMIAGTVVLAALVVQGARVDPVSLPVLLLVPVLVGYAQALRYLLVRRSDESVWSQLGTVLLAPFAIVWAFTVLRVVRWYGMVTCMKTGSWGTRDEGVEVSLSR